MSILVGCDPEVFIWSKTSFINPHSYLPGTRLQPHLTEYGCLYSDGLRYKFNITPAANQNLFVRNVKNTFAELQNVVSKIDAKVLVTPWAVFPRHDWVRFPAKHKLTDSNCEYNKKGDITWPVNLSQKDWRIAGGHVHIGWDDDIPINDADHRSKCRRIADSCSFNRQFKSHSIMERKRELVIGDSPWRPKPYGIELRAPSARWIKSEESMREIYFTLRNYSFGIIGE